MGAVAGEEAVVRHAVPDVPLRPLDGVGAEERHLRGEQQEEEDGRRRTLDPSCGGRF